MYKALFCLLRGELRWFGVDEFAGMFLLASLYPPSSLFYFPISWSIKTTSRTLASTSPYSAFITHHNLSSFGISKVFIINSLYLSRDKFPWKKGVRLTNWEALYFPGGKSKFSRLLERLINLLRSPALSIIYFKYINTNEVQKNSWSLKSS